MNGYFYVLTAIDLFVLIFMCIREMYRCKQERKRTAAHGQ